MANCQEPFQGNAHEKECIPRHQDVLNRIPEVREEVHVEITLLKTEYITNYDANKKNVDHCKIQEALVKCRSSVSLTDDYDCDDVSNKANGSYQRESDFIDVEIHVVKNLSLNT